ncbi:MAG: ASCH domain-containing protein [Candidatus Woesearchaeota archaeon]
MKVLKFRKYLSELILKGDKYKTWRLFDDKDLMEKDVVSMIIWESGEEFAKARLTKVKTTTFGKLIDDDWEGNEKFESIEETYNTYEKYYKKKIDDNTPLKVITFEIIKFS